MTGFLAAAYRDGTLRRTAVAAVVLAVVFRFAFGESWPMTVAVVVAASGTTLATDYADHRGTPTAVRHLAFGAAFVAVGGWWWALAGVGSAPPPLAVVAFVAGPWFLLDGWTARRAGHPDASESPGDDTADELAGLADGGFASELRAFRSLGEVGRAIDDGATTPEAIAAELDRPVASVEDDLDALETAGVVDAVGDEPTDPDNAHKRRYRRSDGEWSATDSVVSWPRRALSRLLRPLRLLTAGGS
ncbi:hypothetical protein [Halobacterium jilantaiense]|uniref:Uncharacterized protein n=1 Tax=Halobacterium jilantaiense TaxID=355548 RepID=A0A1I0N8F6_9EURY|nr:hypothetical protein [Halobacterium jilantaiense]SEV97181.1 hypothetical protein SAMN04487945_0666 [Halobacterium jilantaiense]